MPAYVCLRVGRTGRKAPTNDVSPTGWSRATEPEAMTTQLPPGNSGTWWCAAGSDGGEAA